LQTVLTPRRNGSARCRCAPVLAPGRARPVLSPGRHRGCRRRYRRGGQQAVAGPRPLRWHDLRHTYGSLLAAAGVDLVTTGLYLYARSGAKRVERSDRCESVRLGAVLVLAQKCEVDDHAESVEDRRPEREDPLLKHNCMEIFALRHGDEVSVVVEEVSPVPFCWLASDLPDRASERPPASEEQADERTCHRPTDLAQPNHGPSIFGP
jgi:hypothetical protein